MSKIVSPKELKAIKDMYSWVNNWKSDLNTSLEAAAKKGENFIRVTVPDQLVDEVRKELIELGYKVSYNRAFMHLTIEWK